MGQDRFEERMVRQLICIDLLFFFRRFAFARDQHGRHARIHQSSCRESPVSFSLLQRYVVRIHGHVDDGVTGGACSSNIPSV